MFSLSTERLCNGMSVILETVARKKHLNGSRNKPHLGQRSLSVHQSAGDKVDQPVPLPQVVTHGMAQVIVGTDIGQHGHQTWRDATADPRSHSGPGMCQNTEVKYPCEYAAVTSILQPGLKGVAPLPTPEKQTCAVLFYIWE